MAEPTAPTYRSDFDAKFLRPDMAAPIFEEAAKQSVVQKIVPQIPLGPNGKDIPYVTGKAEASWVDEGARKPLTETSVGIKTMVSKKLAAIFVMSAEVARQDPANYSALVKSQIAEAFALAFDLAALHGKKPSGAAGPFTTYLDQTTKSVEIGLTANTDGGVYGDLNKGLKALVDDGKKLKSWVFDDKLEPALNDSFDTAGRPLLVVRDSADVNAVFRQGTALNRPAFIGEGVADGQIAGYGGDFSKARWGVVGGISFDINSSTAVTINNTLTSLWEHNLVAVRAEAEYGFLVHDTEAFVKLTTPADES